MATISLASRSTMSWAARSPALEVSNTSRGSSVSLWWSIVPR